MKKTILNPKWWEAVGIRVIKTCAETALGVIGGSALVVSDVNWGVVLSAVGLSAVVTILLNLRELPEMKTEETEDEGK